MFSQNVFSARDALANSAINENNAWSELYSQATSSSQNSQLSSMEMFSQQKGPVSSKFDQYQRSQSQLMEDEPANYYSKYLNNPPLFPTSSQNNKLSKSTQAFIAEEKQNITMKEERDMLQTFINLLKDYTKEVDSSFKNFKNDMEATLEAILQNTQDGTQRVDDKITTMKQEIISILDARDRECEEKQELNKSISEQSGTIKVLETKTEILEKQLEEMKNKESAYVDQKTKFQEVEQKYFRSINQWNQTSSYIGNTPPLSQHTDTIPGFQIPPLHHADHASTAFPNGTSSANTDYGCNRSRNDHYNPSINRPTVPSNPHHANFVPCASCPSHSLAVTAQPANAIYSGEPNSMNYNKMPSQPNQSQSTTNRNTQSVHCSKSNNTGSPAARSCGLNVSRRNTKRPKQSPMAMVKPQVRQSTPLLDDEIFICDVPDSTGPNETPLCWDEGIFVESYGDSEKHTPFSGNARSDGKKKYCRQEESAKRKRSSVSMLGISSDDSEVQEIKNELQAQSRLFKKRIKSLP